VDNRDAEDAHDAIADELVKGAAQPLDLRAEPQVVRAQESPNVFRVCLVGAGRKADQVTEENGDDPTLLCEHVPATQRGPTPSAEPEAVRIHLPAHLTSHHGSQYGPHRGGRR
jgi:hypothetical protein